MATIKLGYAPTRRSIFSAPDAIKYRGLTADRLKELGIPAGGRRNKAQRYAVRTVRHRKGA